MSKYMDADFILRGIENGRTLIKDGKMDSYKEHYLSFLEKCVEVTPSIDLVRCKECLHSYEWDSGCGAELVCKVRRCDPADWGSRVEFYVKADDFCSRGERK